MRSLNAMVAGDTNVVLIVVGVVVVVSLLCFLASIAHVASSDRNIE